MNCLRTGPRVRFAKRLHAAARNHAVSKGNKSYLPSKDCASCGLPFSWRKKWARNWGDVKYCSARCRANKPANKGKESPHAG
jgi:hypothetical protein